MPYDTPEFCKLVQELMKKFQVPGLAIAVVRWSVAKALRTQIFTLGHVIVFLVNNIINFLRPLV
jgi:hypothetical protein